MAARRQRFLMFLFKFIFSVHSLFYFGVGLISDTVFVSEIWELNSMIHSRLSILFGGSFPQIEDYSVSSMLPFTVQQFFFS